MDADEKRLRDLDLLRTSRRALDEGALVDRHAPADPTSEPDLVERRKTPRDDQDVVMYRGRAVRRSNRRSNRSAGQSRGTQVGGSRNNKAAGGDDVRAILEKLNALYKDGLITKSEYDRKRRQIIDRL